MTRTAHEVRFPRYHEDVNSERRTLMHIPIDDCAWAIGDELRLLAAPGFPRCKVGVLTDVRQVRLLDDLDADLGKLGEVDRAGYLARWDALHPELPSASDPVVWRIEFRYGRAEDPPEWSLAT
jgi:hypothetical protein